MKTTSSARKPISAKKQIKRHLRNQLRRKVRSAAEKSRVLKFGIRGISAVRDRADELKRWVTATALRVRD